MTPRSWRRFWHWVGNGNAEMRDLGDHHSVSSDITDRVLRLLERWKGETTVGICIDHIWLLFSLLKGPFSTWTLGKNLIYRNSTHSRVCLACALGYSGAKRGFNTWLHQANSILTQNEWQTAFDDLDFLCKVNTYTENFTPKYTVVNNAVPDERSIFKTPATIH